MPTLNLMDLKQLKSHPAISGKTTFGQSAADKLTSFIGSWIFILIFIVSIIFWILTNSYLLIEILEKEPFDPFPFILLNLALSTLTAVLAPIILMSQNRHSQKDRIRTEYDYAVNRKAEREIVRVQNQLDKIEKKLDNLLKQS